MWWGESGGVAWDILMLHCHHQNETVLNRQLYEPYLYFSLSWRACNKEIHVLAEWRQLDWIIIIIIIIYPLTARVVEAPQMISQPVFSIFPCSPLPPGT